MPSRSEIPSVSHGPGAQPRLIWVPWGRLPGWIERFSGRHPGTTWEVTPDSVSAIAADGAAASFDVPFPALAGTTLHDLYSHLTRPWQVGYLLVRRGGFALARGVGSEVVVAKIGRRHVQGKTKAGGWSQQRFARRRSNQAQAAYDAAADYAAELLVPCAASLDLLAVGGDRTAVAAILEMPRLSALQRVPRRTLTAYGEPGRDMLSRAVGEVRSVHIRIRDPTQPQ